MSYHTKKLLQIDNHNYFEEGYTLKGFHNRNR